MKFLLFIIIINISKGIDFENIFINPQSEYYNFINWNNLLDSKFDSFIKVPVLKF